MKLKKFNCYRVDLHYVGINHEFTRHDVIIPCDLLASVIEDEINECDIIIKEKTFIYLPDEC